MLAVALAALCAACGPSPRPVPALPAAEETPHFVPDQPRVAWSMDTGAGLLSPVSTRGPVFFATTTNRMVVAVAADNGRRFWYQRFDSPINTGVEIQNGRVYFATESLKGEAFALDATRGRKVWSRRIGATRLRPVAVGDQILFATDSGSVFSLSRDRGDVKWRARFPGRLVFQPVVLRNRVITATSLDSIYALDLPSGAITQRAGLPGRPTSEPLLLGESLYLTLIDAALAAVNVQTLAVEFSVRMEATSLATPQVIGGSVYVLDRNADVFKLQNRELQRIASLGSAASSSFNAVGSRLLAGLLDGRLVALDESGKQLWEYQAARSIISPVTPVIDGLLVPMKNGGVLKLQ